MTRTINCALIGLGSVHRNLLNILFNKRDRIAADHGLEFNITLVADSSGLAGRADGFDPRALLALKERGGKAAELAATWSGEGFADSLSEIPVDLVFEASPVDLERGGPGLEIARQALGRSIHVVLANKGPVVLAYDELHELAAANGAGLAFSATVCGGLPILNIGRRDMVAADVSLLRGIFNATSNFILDEMATGRSYDDALAEAQRRGIAEADPSLDVGGWDTANKLVIIANSMLGGGYGLADIEVRGIEGITQEEIRAERDKGNCIKLLAVAEGGRLSVRPVALPQTDFLAACTGWEMAVEIHSDIYGRMYHKLWEREPVPTAASMLRDAVNILTGDGGG